MSSSLVLTRYYITEQSWLFLFNVGSGVHSRLAGQQWAGADFDWNISINAMRQNDPASYTLNDVRQLLYIVSYTAHCPRQAKNGRLLFIFRNIEVTVTPPM